MFAFAIYDLRGAHPVPGTRPAGGEAAVPGAAGRWQRDLRIELKALTAHPSLRREADPLAVEDYLAWGYVPDADRS
jgi:asparagine synthase (glutamine-hydrolysing)